VILANFILDSGVFVAAAFSEPHTPQAVALLKRVEHESGTMHAPALLYYEIASVIRMAVYSRRLSPSQGIAIRKEMLDKPVALHFDRGLVERAYDLAQAYGLSRTYDAQYLALAERLGCEFWTGDERLFNSVRTGFPLIRWLGQVEG
jgi:predicted nucleic acid-binding protein